MDARLDRDLETMTSTANRHKQKDRRREARVAAKEAVVDLVSDCSDMEDDDDARGSSTGIGGSKRKRRGGRSEGARSKSRGKKAREVEVETDSDDVPRYLHPDRVGRPIADYAPGYDLVANKVQLEAMRAIGTVWGPSARPATVFRVSCAFLEGGAHYGYGLRGERSARG